MEEWLLPLVAAIELEREICWASVTGFHFYWRYNALWVLYYMYFLPDLQIAQRFVVGPPPMPWKDIRYRQIVCTEQLGQRLAFNDAVRLYALLVCVAITDAVLYQLGIILGTAKDAVSLRSIDSGGIVGL
ncbi:hypothetical protein BG74_00855 [Sodalis-like endosymbiont of Proechinophthirus fluctus]|nr:hypothetical protein BG74_00855 [Sodalis-like endosymbiont of Proechinophthirus fluctus]